MKLIIASATGFAGTETLRQALQSPIITSIVTIGRKPCPIPEDTNSSKLQDFVLTDFLNYSEPVKEQFADADACIWTIAITPRKSKEMAWDDIKRVSAQYPLAGLKAMIAARSAAKKPLRFIYYSGAFAERDQTKVPHVMPELLLMRGQVELDLLATAAASNNAVQVCCIKPGLIMAPDFDESKARGSAPNVKDLPKIKVEECIAATLKLAIDGIEKEPLSNDDLVQMGRAWLDKTG